MKLILCILVLCIIPLFSSCSLEKRVTITTRGFDPMVDTRQNFNHVIKLNNSYFNYMDRDTILDYRLNR